jgi:hypothetical protein
VSLLRVADGSFIGAVGWLWFCKNEHAQGRVAGGVRLYP